MGYKHGMDHSGDTGHCASGDSCESNSCDGLVQQQALEGVEKYISVDRKECKGGRIGSSVNKGEESMVGVFGGHTITEGGVSAYLGNTTSNLANVSTMRS
nr:hypothetical protein CFP56_71379 [Quercus suber]